MISFEQIDKDIKKLQLEKEKILLEQELENIKKPLPKFEDKKYDTKISDETVYKIKSMTKWFYIVPFSLLFLCGFLIFYCFTHFSIIITIVATIISFPFIIGSIIFLFVRFFVFERKKISKRIIKKLSKNFIIINFFKDNKRLEHKVCLINSDGLTCSDGKKEYTIDKESIWLDENNHPNQFNLVNLPNGLLFDFQTNINSFVKNLMDKFKDLSNEGNNIVVDKNNRTIDISYSSENLQLLKRDKIFNELHRNPNAEKMQMILIGALLISNLFWLIAFMLRK